MKVNIGILSIQGAVSEHVDIVNRTLARLGLKGEGLPVRRPPDLDRVDALIIPGGESTTIGKLLVRFGLHDLVIKRAGEGMPVMGTCAGCILLAKEGDDEVERTSTRLLGLMDIAVDRNAFGRQRESFEMDVTIEGLKDPFHAVFIRAPAIVRTWGQCTPLAEHKGLVLAARQRNLLALTFHPELTDDLRIHSMFVEML